MSKHEIGMVIFILLALTIYGLGFIIAINVWLYAVLIFAYLLVLICASLNIGSNYYLKTIISGNTQRNIVALTFDDGPDPVITPMVLDILSSRNIPATFFCIGKKVLQNKKVIDQIVADGHLLGNHSHSHKASTTLMPAFVVKNEIQKANQALLNIAGKKVNFFRPPFGVTTPAMYRALKGSKMYVIGWNNRSFDTIGKDGIFLIGRIKNNLKPGGIILLHDNLSCQSKILPEILDLIEEEGYEIVSLDKLIKKNAYDHM